MPKRMSDGKIFGFPMNRVKNNKNVSTFWTSPGGAVLFLVEWIIANHYVSTNAVVCLNRVTAGATARINRNKVAFRFRIDSFVPGLVKVEVSGQPYEGNLWCFEGRRDLIVEVRDNCVLDWDGYHFSRSYHFSASRMAVNETNNWWLGTAVGVNFCVKFGPHITVFQVDLPIVDSFVDSVALPENEYFFGHGEGERVVLHDVRVHTQTDFVEVLMTYDLSSWPTAQQRRYLFQTALSYVRAACLRLAPDQK